MNSSRCQPHKALKTSTLRKSPTKTHATKTLVLGDTEATNRKGRRQLDVLCTGLLCKTPKHFPIDGLKTWMEEDKAIEDPGRADYVPDPGGKKKRVRKSQPIDDEGPY